MMKMLGVPKSAFGDMETQLLRFDLDGDRRLDEYEVYQCIKMNLFEYSKQSGQGTHDIGIPHKSLQAAGYQLGKMLGHGNQGCAYKGKNSLVQRCCIKSYSKASLDKAAADSLQDEYNVLHNLSRHPNVALAFDIFQDESSYYMIQELYAGGDFESLLHRGAAAKVQMDEAWWRALFKQCFLGIAHLHSNGLMHCDIKESNLMLRTDNYKEPAVVIIDFGLCGQPQAILLHFAVHQVTLLQKVGRLVSFILEAMFLQWVSS